MSGSEFVPIKHFLTPPAQQVVGKKPRLIYSGDSAAAKLERAMHEKNVFAIGEQDSWKNRVNEKGDVRNGGLDMSPESRAYRTVDVKKLTAEELARVHDFELRRMIFFVIGPSSMRRILKNPDLPDQLFLQPEQIKYLTTFNNIHRPIADRYFMGLPIPPYFYYDYDFDGMLYHHAWDKSVWRAPLELPQRKRGKGKISDNL